MPSTRCIRIVLCSIYIYICNSVFHATVSTGWTRCWNIKEGRWNQCRLTWHSIVSPPNLHFPKYHHYSIHTNTNTNTYSSEIPPLFYSHKYKYTYQSFKKFTIILEKKTFEILFSLNSPYFPKNRGAIADPIFCIVLTVYSLQLRCQQFTLFSEETWWRHYLPTIHPIVPPPITVWLVKNCPAFNAKVLRHPKQHSQKSQSQETTL